MVGEFNALADLSVQVLSYLSGTAVKEMQEPDYTAALSSFFPILLNLHPPLGHIRFGGCFVHQKPKVTFHSSRVTGKSETCEAGDLMVLCRQTIDGEERYNAIIFQIKMHKAPFSRPHVITARNEQIQKELYSFWPPFSITEGKTTTNFDILPKTITPAAQYMMVRRLGSRSEFSISYPDSSIVLDKYENIGRCIYELVKWQTGRPITCPEDPKKDEWSKFVWNIVATSKRSVYARKNVNINSSPRATGDFFQMLVLDSSSFQGELEFSCSGSRNEFWYSFEEEKNKSLLHYFKENQYKYYNESDDANGMSLLFIDVLDSSGM